MFLAVVWVAVIVVATIQLVFGIGFFRHVYSLPSKADGIRHRSAVPPFATHPLSVIICAHNEEVALGENLKKVLEQHYRYPDGSPAFEVIVVNDASTDSTDAVLAALGVNYPHLRVVPIAPQEVRDFPGKKFALSRGLAAATHEWIVCTDADCKPASDAWLHYMAAPLIAGKEIVAGYGGYEKTQSILNTFIRYETVHTFLQYYSFNRAGMPFMAVGRNLAATREVFLKAQRHPAWNLLPSGDDDLLVQLCADRTNMAVVAHPGSFTWSKGQEQLTKYLRQKQRHVSTGKYYKPWTKVALGLYATANELWWILLIILLGNGAPGMPLLILFVPWLFLVITFQQGGSFLWERTTVLGWIVFSFCWMLYNAVLAPYILWKSKQRWK